MSTKREIVPSLAQAKLLARLWGEGRGVCVGGYIDPTAAACIKRGWLSPNGETGTFPNGAPWVRHVASPYGLLALERFLAFGKAQPHKENV